MIPCKKGQSWWRHQMETFSALLALCAGNSPVPGEFPAQRPVTRSFDVFFDVRLNKRLSKQPWGWWFETPSWSFWRHRNAIKWTAFDSLIIHIMNEFQSWWNNYRFYITPIFSWVSQFKPFIFEIYSRYLFRYFDGLIDRESWLISMLARCY